MMTDMKRINADYIYCLLNGRRMTLTELSSYTHLDTQDVVLAIDLLRNEKELMEYSEDGKEYIELRCGYAV